jgi:hypothetical protein
MLSILLPGLLALVSLTPFIHAQSPPEDGYIGYKLAQRGDPLDATYDTASTSANVSLTDPPPDVFLNASVHVGEIDIVVQNLSAKINLDAQVLQLLQFNAGVDASIDRVSLLIQNVSARVTLEARLGNVVEMINSVLDSIDLNPVLASLGDAVGEVVGDVGDVVGGLAGGASGSGSTGGANSTGNAAGATDTTAALDRRSFELENSILFAVNDYAGDTHTNRILAPNGDIVNQALDNDGAVRSETAVGSYKTDMKFNGYEKDVERDGKMVKEQEWVYEPFVGLVAVCMIYLDGDEVVATRLIAEARGGGESVIQADAS